MQIEKRNGPNTPERAEEAVPMRTSNGKRALATSVYANGRFCRLRRAFVSIPRTDPEEACLLSGDPVRASQRARGRKSSCYFAAEWRTVTPRLTREPTMRAERAPRRQTER